MNNKRVEQYIITRLDEYRKCYDTKIFDGFTFDVYGGSFGATLISLSGKYYSISSRYVGNYDAIDREISNFVVRSFDNLCEKAYWREKKEQERGLRFTLDIYNDNKIVNHIESDDANDVKNELIKILISKEVRLVKTTFKHIPYTNNLKVIQKWNKDTTSLPHNTKYVYMFYNVDF